MKNLIPQTEIKEGIELCYRNAERLLNGAEAILSSQYASPTSIDPNYLRDMNYSSCCGLVVLAIEEIGKRYFLLQKYQTDKDVSDKEWEGLTRDRKAHIRKIEKAKSLLRLKDSSLAKELNEMKKRDIYVDWKNGWQSPLDFQIRFKEPKYLLKLGRTALRELECHCQNANIII